MIACEMCKSEIKVGKVLVECCEVIHSDEDLTVLLESAKIHRFCEKCWNVVMSKLTKNKGDRV
jgi:hypothetical protein